MNLGKLFKNINWKLKYTKLNKKYELALDEINSLKEELNSDLNLQKLKNNKKYTQMLKRQRDELRSELNGRRSNIRID